MSRGGPFIAAASTLTSNSLWTPRVLEQDTVAGANLRLRMLIALHPEALTVVARADSRIVSFEDLKGARIGLGKSGCGYMFTRDIVLAFYGITIPDKTRMPELEPAEQNVALCADAVDAIFFAAGHPNGLTQEATTGCPARLVRLAGPPIDRLLEANPYYVAAVIPGGMYDGNPQDIATIGTRAIIVTTADQPDALAMPSSGRCSRTSPISVGCIRRWRR